MELLFRIPGSEESSSPFESALWRMAESGRVDLAVPYLSVAMLRDVVSRTEAFRLVTDAEEWLRAYARPARREILDVIRQHSSDIRHYRDLHAKVALSPTLVMLGSANFTARGFHIRHAVGALLNDSAQVASLAE